MIQKQKTIKNEISLDGVGLHTGCRVRLVLKPAAENSGIQFIRVDLPARPVIKATIENIRTDTGIPRCTTIGVNGCVIHTIEHLMSVLSGLGISNLNVEIDAEELPGLDGSALDFLTAIKKVGIEEQRAICHVFEIKEPLGVEQNGSSIYISPADDLKISYSLQYNQPFLNAQIFDITISDESFEKEIAPCRTFCLEEEANELAKRGLGKGANFENTLVIGKDGIKNNKVRFPDEFARHKVLDFIGDLYLLGMPIRGHVFAVKSGHALNLAILKKIAQQKEKYDRKGIVIDYPIGDKKMMSADEIMKVLPHRYPFLLVDKVVLIEKGKKAVGIKNVTINEPFFQGHFPSRPIMPGVLMVEAMAQTSGVALLTNEIHHGKVAFFMSADNVKFRKIIVPGDQLVIEVEIVKEKTKFALLRGVVKVDNEVAAEADIVLSYISASFLD